MPLLTHMYVVCIFVRMSVCRYAPSELELSIFHDNIVVVFVVVASFVT